MVQLHVYPRVGHRCIYLVNGPFIIPSYSVVVLLTTLAYFGYFARSSFICLFSRAYTLNLSK